MNEIINGERPSRPSRGKELGLSDELWELVRSSWAQEVEERPSVSAFVDFLKKATPDISVLKGLTELDANSEEYTQKIHLVFGYGDNTLLGMREEDALVLIEIFDRVTALLNTPPRLSNISDPVWIQVLNSSLNISTLRSQCLHGLQRVSARCGLLPKSYWISHARLADPNCGSSSTGTMSSTRQRLMDGRLVAVKTISPDRVENFNTFNRVRLPPPKSLLSMSFIFGALAETVREWDYVEAITASKCGQLPWVCLRRSSLLPCIPLDVQRELARICAREP